MCPLVSLITSRERPTTSSVCMQLENLGKLELRVHYVGKILAPVGKKKGVSTPLVDGENYKSKKTYFKHLQSLIREGYN